MLPVLLFRADGGIGTSRLLSPMLRSFFTELYCIMVIYLVFTSYSGSPGEKKNGVVCAVGRKVRHFWGVGSLKYRFRFNGKFNLCERAKCNKRLNFLSLSSSVVVTVDAFVVMVIRLA